MKRAIFIEGRRDGYHPEQCDYIITVGELKEMLEQFNDDDKIFLSNDNGYTYGSITDSSFESGKYDLGNVYLDE